jgi:aldose 1-epimerase
VNYPIQANRVGEPYPIHGDGWLQPWDLHQTADNTVEMRLESQAFEGNPYAYQALQRFVLLEGGMDQTLTVTHQGARPLPYGLGQHPFFLRSPTAQLTAPVQGVWLCGADPLPTEHTTDFPASWDLRAGMQASGVMIDNVYTGWSGQARLVWPEHQLALTVSVPEIQARGLNDGYCLVYRPPFGQAFCFEPVTHPIDAFHAPGQPGLRLLHAGESLTLHVEWRFTQIA